MCLLSCQVVNVRIWAHVSTTSFFQQRLSYSVTREELSIPPNALRNALAKTCSASFSIGKLGDPIEAYQAVLLRLHAHLVDKSCVDKDSCEALHCIVHRKFAMNIVEQNVCQRFVHSVIETWKKRALNTFWFRCHAAGEPTPSWELFRWISSRDILDLENATQDDFLRVLRLCASNKCDAKRPGSETPCGGRSQPSKALLNSPDVFSLCIGWDTTQSRPDEIRLFLDLLPVELSLDNIFQHAVDPRASNKLTLVGIVCYYGMHYSLFFYHSLKRTWIYLDDSMVTDIGNFWDPVRFWLNINFEMEINQIYRLY